MSGANFTPELDSILADCLEDVLSGRGTVAECLARYPQYAAELRPALQVSLLVARLRSPEMSAAAVDSLESHLRAQMSTQRFAPPRRVIHLPLAVSRMAATFIIVFLLMVGSGAGLVAASANSLPGDPLYGIKRLWEAIVLALSPLTGPRDELWLQIADMRLDEVNRLDALGRLNDSALTDLYRAGAETLRAADADSQERIIAWMGRARADLLRIQPPPEGQTVYQDLLNITVPQLQGGVLQAPPGSNPPSLEVTPLPTLATIATLTFTPTATPSPTLTPTATATITASPSPTPEPSATPSPTGTPRIPPTPTRTPTLTPSSTFTPTPTYTPTATWTPLPLPQWPTLSGLPTAIPAPGVISPTPTPVGPTLNATERIRETEQSVYMTQTAGPPRETPTNPP